MRADLMSIHSEQRKVLNDLHRVHLEAIRLRLKIWVSLGHEMTEEAVMAITAEDVSFQTGSSAPL